jgi:hypothetical protein
MSTCGSNARWPRPLPPSTLYIEAAHAASEYDDAAAIDEDRDPLRAARGIIFTALAVLNLGLVVAFLT